MQGTNAVQDQTLSYDDLDRLARVQAQGSVDLQMSYDKVGNKTHEHIAYVSGGSTQTQDLWFGYDAMNRQTVADGAVDGNPLNQANITPTQCHILGYDHNGNRISDNSYGVEVVPQYVQNYDESGNALGPLQFAGYGKQTGVQTQWYHYDSMNRLDTVATGAYAQVQVGVDGNGNPIYQTTQLPEQQAIVLDQREYDGSSRVLRSGPTDSLDPAYVSALVGSNTNLSGATTTITQYDPAGRQC